MPFDTLGDSQAAAPCTVRAVAACFATSEPPAGAAQTVRRMITCVDALSLQRADLTDFTTFEHTAFWRGLGMIRLTGEGCLRASRGRLGMPAQAMSASSMVSHGTC